MGCGASRPTPPAAEADTPNVPRSVAQAEPTAAAPHGVAAREEQPNEAEPALAAAAEACIAAGEAHPCRHCGDRFAEQWGAAPWHCFNCKKPLAPQRTPPEDAAKAAAAAVDAPYVAGGALTPEGEKRHAWRGVLVAWLVAFCASLPAGTTTVQAVARFVKPATQRLRCRYVELPEMRGRVGKPCAFVSHTWYAPFADLVAAIRHALGDHEYV